MHSSTSIFFLNSGTQSTQYSKWGYMNTKYSGIMTSFDWLVMLCFVQPRMQFVLLATRAHCWLILSLLSTSTPRSCSAELLFIHFFPSLHWFLVLLHPRCRIQHLFLFYVVSLMITQCSNLSRSLCKASCPSRDWTAPPSLVSTANFLMMCYTPAYRSLINILNRTDPGIKCWGTLLVSSQM